MTQIRWITKAGTLGTIPEGRFYKLPLEAAGPSEIGFRLVAGRLPQGVQVKPSGALEGVPEAVAITQGVPLSVNENVISKFTVRAFLLANPTVIADRTFSITVTGQDAPRFVTPAGSLGAFLDSTRVSIPIAVEDDDNESLVIRVAGGALPAGLRIDGRSIVGVIEPPIDLSDQGVAVPAPEDIAYLDSLPLERPKYSDPWVGQDLFDLNRYDAFNFAYSTLAIDKNYQFTLEVTDGKEFDRRQYSIFVMSRNNVVAGDDLAALYGIENHPSDWTTARSPFILTPTNLGRYRHKNFLSIPIEVVDFDGDQVGISVFVFDESWNSKKLPLYTVFDGGNLTFDDNSTTFPIDTVDVCSTFDFELGSTTFDDNELKFETGTLFDGSTTFDDNELKFNQSLTTGTLFDFDSTTFDNNAITFDFDKTKKLPLYNLDSSSANFIYGYIHDIKSTEQTFNIKLIAYKVNSPNTRQISSHVISFYGDADTELTWNVSTHLGDMVAGFPSLLSVSATSRGNHTLRYFVTPPEFVIGKVRHDIAQVEPLGISLLPTGELAGRPRLAQFTLDSSRTTFDSEIFTRREIAPTTFDRTFFVPVTVVSVGPNNEPDDVIRISKEFTFTVKDSSNTPWENVYARAMPPHKDRNLLENMLTDDPAKVFADDIVYRRRDRNFGVSESVVYGHAYGIAAASAEQYAVAATRAHYRKHLILGATKIAVAKDASDQVVYEVLYSEIIDQLADQNNQSISQRVRMPAIENRPVDSNGALVTGVYPNSLVNMRNRLFSEVGAIVPGLPLWMLSKQNDGRVLGYVPAWPIAYAKPGRGQELLYKFKEAYEADLSSIDFYIDRFIVDRTLTAEWSPADQLWPVGETTVIETISSDSADKYIMFPQQGVFK